MQALLRHAFPIAIVLYAGGCGVERESREWRPEDHRHPTGASESEGDRAAPGEDSEEGDLAVAAAALYRARCAACHGASGRGDGPAAPPGATVPDLSNAELQASRTDDDLARVIRDGRGMMPGFRSEINEQGIEALITHLRTLRATQE